MLWEGQRNDLPAALSETQRQSRFISSPIKKIKDLHRGSGPGISVGKDESQFCHVRVGRRDAVCDHHHHTSFEKGQDEGEPKNMKISCRTELHRGEDTYRDWNNCTRPRPGELGADLPRGVS